MNKSLHRQEILLPSLESITRFLLFLFPIFAVWIRHWASAIFLLLALLSILLLRSSLRGVSLSKLEKWLFLFMALFFVVYVVASSLNGWDDRAIRLLERELRFLFFIPIYLLLRRISGAFDAFGLGALVAIFLSAIIAPIQVFVFSYGRDIGVYGPLFTGPITVLFLLAAIAWAETHLSVGRRQMLIAVAMVLTLFVALLCGRGAVLGVGLVVFAYYLFVVPNHRYFFTVVFLSVTLLYMHEFKGNFSAPTFESAWVEAKNYVFFQLANSDVLNPHAETSVGTRLEMIRSLQYFIRDYPLFGVGGYGYQDAVSNYVAQGLVSKAAVAHAHPHNAFAQVLVSKGLVGLSIFLAIFVSTVSILTSRLKNANESTFGKLGLIFLATLVLLNLTESPLVLKGNYIACSLLILSVFLVDRQRRSFKGSVA